MLKENTPYKAKSSADSDIYVTMIVGDNVYYVNTSVGLDGRYTNDTMLQTQKLKDIIEQYIVPIDIDALMKEFAAEARIVTIGNTPRMDEIIRIIKANLR